MEGCGSTPEVLGSINIEIIRKISFIYFLHKYILTKLWTDIQDNYFWKDTNDKGNN